MRGVDAARGYWPIGYDDLESDDDTFDGVCGEIPNPPLTLSHNMCRSRRRHATSATNRFHARSIASRPYVNPDGAALSQCH